MGKTEKVAVTVDREVLGAAERLRKKTGESRSTLVTRALKLLLTDEERKARVADYVATYEEHPETQDEIDSAMQAAATSLKGVPW